MSKTSNISLRTKLSIVLVVLTVVSLVLNMAWSVSTRNEQMVADLREKGEVLAQQMDAVWEFMSINQDRFESSAYIGGSDVYQGLHCAIAGRSIGFIFTRESNYVTRFVNFNPRNISNRPDEFESKALDEFFANSEAKEYYELSTYEGSEAFRYLAPMTIEKNCLACHGDPAGELDITGFPKEGWQIGDIGGAISIVIPVDMYRDNERTAIVQDVVFSVAFFLACIGIIYIALSRYVTKPLERIQTGLGEISAGSLDVRLEGNKSSKEISKLIVDFNQMADELSTVYSNLERQVADRTSELAEANLELEKQQQALKEINDRLRDDSLYKSEFLAMMSHELKTPLTSILAYAELLRKNVDPLREEEVEVGRAIEMNSRSLLSMINDILKMSRLEFGRERMNYSAVDVGDLLGLAASSMQQAAQKKGIELTYEIDSVVPLIYADFDKLQHVMENLLSNAIKFSKKNGRVQIHSGYDAKANEVWISVSDNGIGIDPRDHERVFEQFVQVDSSESRSFEGTGLGLALALNYIKMHEGTLELESELGSGAQFTVRVPAITEEQIEEGGGNV